MSSHKDGMKFVNGLIDKHIVVCPKCKEAITKNEVENNEVFIYGKNYGSHSKQQEALVFHKTEVCSTLLIDISKYFDNVNIIKYAYMP